MAEAVALSATDVCAQCSLELAASALACPSCHALRHAAELRSLASSADQQLSTGQAHEAVLTYRRVLELLPSGSRQHEQVARKIDSLTVPSRSEARPAKKSGAGAALGLGAVAVVLWQLKTVLLLLLGKAKFLLLGFTKLGTVLTMAASLGAYWALWGWQLAIGLILSIYVHEMGHVAALRRLGIAASAPMFIPGLGAFVRLKQYPASPREDARVGLAGPVWGFGAALAALAAGFAFEAPMLLAIAQLGAWLNLFNLIPFGPLDGGRAFRSLGARERWLACGAAGAAFLVFHGGLLILLIGVGVVRAFAASSAGASDTDRRMLAGYSFLVAALSAIASVDVPVPGAS